VDTSYDVLLRVDRRTPSLHMLTPVAGSFSIRGASVGLLALLWACSLEPAQPTRGPEVRREPAGASGPSESAAPETLCPPDNPFCTGNPEPTGIPTEVTTEFVCANEPIDLTPVGINIMIAVDGSSSMETHWPRIQEAIRSLRLENPGASFGIQLFWAELVESFDEAVMQNNACGATQNRVLDVGDHGDQELVDFLGAAPPGPAFRDGRWEISPVVDPLNYYLQNATALADPTRTNYLLFMSDGNDNCFGSIVTSKTDKLLAYQKLAIELSKQNIRTIPIGFDAASRPGSSGMFGMTEANTDLDVLQTLLDYGGSGLTEVPKVDDPAKLAEVVAKVGQSVRNCRFAIPATLDPTNALNPFELTFTINGRAVMRDRVNQEGWNFVPGGTSEVELFGQACQAVRAAQPIEARKTCESDVCGTAAVRVETRPRAVLFLLDASASRIECADGTYNCLIPPDVGWERTLSFWEVVQNAVAQSLAMPINDDVDFGIQFFPGKDAEILSCDVATEPETTPADGTEITIMKKMFEKLPFGWSPVVQVLENVAASPGRLADPDVLGTVVLLSDGGDNCAEVEQPEIVQRVGAAAKTLLDQGVKTYVVRFGSEAGRTPEQDEQLRAIVSNGGTDESDPNDPSKSPYLDVKTADELNAALAAIADRLATCSFTLGDLPTDVDKAKANLYLNGEVVPFDAAASKQSGWNWADTEQTTMELYGDSCEAFKTNRRTSVVVEFGCMVIPVELI
jgi:hypothetical protein